ncbi:MAG TPA: nucleoid-associated protein [Firmicutes bacterium]|nr:nucleoid-associated protein [Bacillota bacterium]
MDLRLLQIARLVIHDIPRKLGGETAGLVLSDVESELDEETRRFLQHRMISVASPPNAFRVRFDRDSTSPVPTQVECLLRSEGELVPVSRILAQYLNKLQTGVNSAGILVVAECRIGSDLVVGIMKLERDEGVRVEPSHKDGLRAFTVIQTRNLIMTSRTKVFKLAIFAMVASEIVGIVCDQQRGYRPTREVAEFFLRFLGCQLLEEPSVTTRRFYQAAENFVNSLDCRAELKYRYMLHVASELMSGEAVLVPETFARRFLELEHQQAFCTCLDHEGLRRPLLKDLSLIEARLERQVLQFRDVLISGRTEAIREKVEVEDLPDGRTRAVVVDYLERVKSK